MRRGRHDVDRDRGWGLWAADWGRWLASVIAFVASQAGLLQLMGPLSERPADFFSTEVAVVVTVVSLAALWWCFWSMGYEGCLRFNRRLGEFRRNEEMYGSDAVPVPHAMMVLAAVPLLLVAPMATTLGMSGRVARMDHDLWLVAVAVVTLVAGLLGRRWLVVSMAPAWSVVVATWFWLPKPIPEALSAALGVVAVGWLAWWLWRRRHRPRARLPFRWGRAFGRARRPDRSRGGVWTEVRWVADLEVGFDERRWIVLPEAGGPEAPPRHRAWARRTAEARWVENPDGASGTSSAKDLAEVLARWATRLPGRHDADGAVEVVLLHHPVGHDVPTPVFVHVLPCAEGTREEVLRRWVRADDEDAVEAPVVEEFEARHLGAGLRALVHLEQLDRASEHGLYAVLSYAWRLQDHGVDVRVSCSTPELGRLSLAVEDIDELVDDIRVEPAPIAVEAIADHPTSPAR